MSAVALLVSVAALVFSVIAFQETQRATDPIVALAADEGITHTLRTGDRLIGTFSYQVAVFTNRGRTPVDVLQVVAVGIGDKPIAADVYFGASCTGGQHATLNPGASLPVVSIQSDPKLVPQYYRVLLATGIEAVPVERRKAGTPESEAILGAYDHETKALLMHCAPERASEFVQ